jgi:hypothetical protein
MRTRSLRPARNEAASRSRAAGVRFSQRLGDRRGGVVGVSVGLTGPAAAGPAGLGVGNANVGDGDGDCSGDDADIALGDGTGLGVGVGVGGGGMIFSQ